MSKYDNSNSGTISKNNNKREGKKDPDYKGKCEVDGVPYWISGWIKNGEHGSFLSLSFKKRDENGKEKSGEKKAAPKPVDDFGDDDIPFN